MKETKHNVWDGGLAMEEVIQNGVKQTELGGKDRKIDEIKDIVENGIKVTKGLGPSEVTEKEINKVIRETYDDAYHNSGRVDGIIRNGIKNTINHPVRPQEVVDKTIKNGIKETNPHFLEILNPINFEPVTKEMKRMNEVNIVLEKGIKEVKELPDKSGELRGYGDYYNRQEDRTKPHTQYVDDVVLNGIKETKYCELHSLMRADHIIRDGIKETKSVHIHNGESIESVIKNGINETKRLKDENRPQIRNIIENGIKQTNWRKVDNHPTYLDSIIDEGSHSGK